jgi:hypothetical protein
MNVTLVGYALLLVVLAAALVLLVDAGATLIAGRMGVRRDSMFSFDPMKVLIIAGIVIFAIVLWTFARSGGA